MTKLAKKKYKTGLVLSGGGTRGFAHLGALKALHENNIEPDIIAGVSAGSIVGALYADGKDADQALRALTSRTLFGFLKPMIPRNGLVRMAGFEKTFKQTLTAKTFEELKIPLVVFAVNINTAGFTQFDKGDLISAVMASSSIPVIFPPVKIGEHYYLDGGIINNFPVEAIREQCSTIIGINVNPIGDLRTINSLKAVAERSFHIFIRNQASSKEKLCDIYIEPKTLDHYGLLDVSKAREIFDEGYAETVKVLKSL
ncbi:MAG TPA: patatin-like phospholipase family protein [Bacteroidales bacterium]|nr:patatin-like phospholipase family protein [Bacteroidales bacterium]